MMMINWMYVAIGTIIISIVAGAGFKVGYDAGYEVNALPLMELRAKVEAADIAAKAKLEEWRKQNEESAKKYHSDATRLRERIRMLQGQIHSEGGVTICTLPSNDPTSQPAVGGVTVEGCALDALQVMGWQSWAKEKHLPVVPQQ